MLWIRCKWVLINIFRSFSSSELIPTKLHLKNCTKSQFIISLNPQLNFMHQVLSRYWRLRLSAHLCLQKVLAQNPTWNQPPKILHLPTIAPWKTSDSTTIFSEKFLPFTQSYKIVIEMKLCDLLASNPIHSSPSKVDSNNITHHTYPSHQPPTIPASPIRGNKRTFPLTIETKIGVLHELTLD